VNHKKVFPLQLAKVTAKSLSSFKSCLATLLGGVWKKVKSEAAQQHN